MYKFLSCWTVYDKISFLQRVILIHSYLYYMKDNPTWSDKKYDEIAKQLAFYQRHLTEYKIVTYTQYGYVFFDYDGTTGFDLFYKLKETDKQVIARIANQIGGK